MYEFVHVCNNVCISLYMYVGVHACMCVPLSNDFINVKTETKQLICCEEIPPVYRQARFLLRLHILSRQLLHLPHNYVATARPVNSVGVTTRAKKLCTTLGIWRAKYFFFVIWGLIPPSPYVEQPLSKTQFIKLYWRRLVKNIGWANQNIGGKRW